MKKKEVIKVLEDIIRTIDNLTIGEVTKLLSDVYVKKVSHSHVDIWSDRTGEKSSLYISDIKDEIDYLKRAYKKFIKDVEGLFDKVTKKTIIKYFLFYYELDDYIETEERIDVFADDSKTDEYNKKKRRSKHISTWDTGLKVISSVTIYLPRRIIDIMENLYSYFINYEYGLFIKIESIDLENGAVYLSDEYYIPEQEVSNAFISFKEHRPWGEWAVIHRHPPGTRKFSKVDEESINTHFQVSLLYLVDEGITDSIFNIKLEDGNIIRLPSKVEITSPKIDFRKEELEKIKTKNLYKPPKKSNDYYSYTWPW